jgi:hypothetical protein
MELDAAYRATSYVAWLPEGALVLRVDEPSPALAHLLQDSGLMGGAFISACNPGSRQLDVEENRARHRQLAARVRRLGLRHYQGLGVPDRSGWPPEPSLLILGIPRENAHALAAEFGQNALLWFDADAVPRLQYVLSLPEAL